MKLIAMVKMARPMRRIVEAGQALEEISSLGVCEDGSIYGLVWWCGRFPEGDATREQLRAAEPRFVRWQRLELNVSDIPEPWP